MPRPLRVKLILPALTEATSPFWRPVKYSLFPPLGLATLAAYLDPDDHAAIEDEHVRPLALDDAPDLVVIQVYITNAYRAYRLADLYRSRGSFVALGGLHVTSLPAEAAAHADTIFLGPGEQMFPQFLADFRAGRAVRRYESTSGRTLDRLPPVRRDLIERRNYLVPNSIVVTRGCPQHCDFCYKDAFFAGGRSFYTQRVDDALAEIDRLPGRHLYFLDDHLLGDRRFGRALFEGMKGMRRLFQGAATVDSILRDDLVERAAAAGLRSLFVGFETLTPANLAQSNKRQNLGRDYRAVTKRLHDLGVMINGSFVFGMDDDDEDVFRRTVDWAIEAGITTATFHIQTPYPGAHHDSKLGSLRHAPCGVQARAPGAEGARGRLRLGVSGVLSLVIDCPCGAHARIPEASSEALHVRVRMEEIRSCVEPGDSTAAASSHDAAPRSGPLESHTGTHMTRPRTDLTERLWRVRRRHDHIDAILRVRDRRWELQFVRNDRVLLTRSHATERQARREADARLGELHRAGWNVHW
jgi:Radical SAM superfamily/B12 binding domain